MCTLRILMDGRLVELLKHCETQHLGVWVEYPHGRNLSRKVRLALDRLALAMTL